MCILQSVTCIKSLNKSSHLLSTICHNVYGRVDAHWSRSGSGGMMWKWNEVVGCDVHACGSGGAGSHVLGAVHIPSYIDSPRAYGLNRSNVSQSLSSAEFSCHHSPLCLTDSPSLCVRVYRVYSTVRHLSPCLTLALQLSRRVRSRRRDSVHEWTTSVVDSYCRPYPVVYQHVHPVSASVSKRQCSL